MSGPARGTFGTTPPRLSGYLDDAFCTMQGLDLEADMDLDTAGLISRNLNRKTLPEHISETEIHAHLNLDPSS